HTSTEHFTIQSANGTVTGTKQLATTAPNSIAFCFPNGGQVSVHDATYQATISTPTGNSVDHGTTATTFNLCNASPADANVCGTIGSGFAYNESFVSEGVTSQPPLAPQTKSDCKNGGWRRYVTLGFKNQGDCESYVATHG